MRSNIFETFFKLGNTAFERTILSLGSFELSLENARILE